MSKIEITTADCAAVETFIGKVLDAYKAGQIDLSRATGALQHPMFAALRGDVEELKGYVRRAGDDLMD
ncbi:hypothetical protein [Hansschlegelia plantiphila]|uniref:Uncharacterized protein n=1 Tax=Hansschlegelia plantiphila TaxID=374655 RepID=A0A9W6IZQ9_9HYPH|nr:hypothetical protein [Hansschlegelia plantiphila]GLK68027.1 hypothetical protein GCM10008179_16650 [Hansschlegelia plantiphila]